MFVIVSVAGFYTLAIVGNVAYKIGVFPDLPPGPYMELFKYWFFGMGMWVWIACALISVSYFFIENEWKNWILLAPMFIPALYGVVTIAYFDLVYTGS